MPTHNVTNNCTYDSDLLELTPDELVFTPENYYIAQTVTVAVAAGAEGLPPSTDAVVTNTVTSPDTAYDALETDHVNVTVVGAASPGSFRFISSTFSVNEGDGSFAVGVERIGGDVGEVTLDFSTLGVEDTATAGTHYTSTNGTLTWIDGVSGTNYFDVIILDNEIYEDTNVFFTVNISNASDGDIVEPSSATVTIIDNDPQGEFSFSTDTASVNEGDGTLTVIVNRLNGSNDAAEVSFTTVDGTAKAGTSYVAQNGTLNWGHREGGSKSFDVTLIDDDTFRGDTVFTIELTGVDVGDIVAPNELTVTIVDNEPFALLDPFKLGGDPSAGEYVEGSIGGQGPVIVGASGNWGASSGSCQIRGLGLEHNNLEATGGSVGHDRSGGGYTGAGRDLASALGAGPEPYTIWFASLHMVDGFTNGGNRSPWKYDLGGGTIRWGIYNQSLHAFGTDIDAAVGGQTYLFVAKLEKNYDGANDRWSVWVDPPLAFTENGLGTPDATGTSDFWKDDNAITQIYIDVSGDGSQSEIGYFDEVRIAESYQGLDLIQPEVSGTIFNIH